MRYLVKQLSGTKAGRRSCCGVSQRTVERYVKDQIKQPRPDLAARLEREVAEAVAAADPRQGPRRRRRHDRRHRHRHPRPLRLHRAPGTTDDRRLRPHHLALPPAYAARLFDAQEAGATEQQLQEIAAEGLKEIYFQDGGRRATACWWTSPTSTTSTSTTERGGAPSARSGILSQSAMVVT